MKSWEFLVQKEGDRQWIPIETPTVELEAGRYRILANSNRCNRNIEVRLTHQLLEGETSIDQSQKYSRQANQQGLVMVLPYTDFSEGIWQIRCSGDILSDLIGETWRETLEIKISPSEVVLNSPEADDLGESIRSQESEKVGIKSTVIENNIDKSPNSQGQYYLEKLEKLLNQKIEPCLDSYGINLEENTRDSFVSLSSPDILKAPTIQLILDQEKLQGNPGDVITLSGSIEVQDADEDLALTGQLRYEIKHPHTDEILVNVAEPIFDQILPYKFSKTLAIPTEIEDIIFILGEVFLETLNGVSLTQYPFKIYTSEHHPVSYSIELLNTEDQSCHKFDFEVAEKIAAKSNNLELPTPAKSSYPLIPSFSTSGKVLPPKLKTESVSQKSEKKSLNLPQIL
ncbi:MAG TPA: hypothetical protein DCF68_04130 [Cyanothece sp. UBA12306]|nr:hypothetical protein [Cyanothece sp. UBA12306]